MRRTLDALYGAAGWVAAVFLMGLLLMVLLTIVSRLLHFYVPGTDAYAGYLMAGSGFLALAHTLKKGEHIRVSLLVNHLQGRARFWLEIWALLLASLLSALFAYYSLRLAWQSHLFNDISTANDATPLWIPQLPMVFGALLLFVACLDELWLHWHGKSEVFRQEGSAHNE
jgi:TRAP-type C4-dicarboxylate transport system permease small subunit